MVEKTDNNFIDSFHRTLTIARALPADHLLNTIAFTELLSIDTSDYQEAKFFYQNIFLYVYTCLGIVPDHQLTFITRD